MDTRSVGRAVDGRPLLFLPTGYDAAHSKDSAAVVVLVDGVVVVVVVLVVVVTTTATRVTRMMMGPGLPVAHYKAIWIIGQQARRRGIVGYAVSGVECSSTGGVVVFQPD